jgi:hypothetical protein
MNLKVEHGIIAILLITFLYYFYKHQSLLSDLSRVTDKGNAELKSVKDKHGTPECDYPWIYDPCDKSSDCCGYPYSGLTCHFEDIDRNKIAGFCNTKR